jgi:tRNA (cytidine56-2'-O)-methyltransferase
MAVHILRLAHRPTRDKRVTTHLGLVGRAFGAEKMLVTGLKDEHLVNSIQRVVDSWGGDFELEFIKSWRATLKQYREDGYSIAHLTMYGLPVQEVIPEIKKNKNLLLVVGGEKVPWGVYDQSDFNVAVTNQPHSEISALSVFLDRFFDGNELKKRFSGARKIITPSKKGKSIKTR